MQSRLSRNRPGNRGAVNVGILQDILRCNKRITEKVRKKVREILLAEVEEYDKYLRGEYFGFVRENNNGEIVDSLFGFTDIKDMLDYLSGEAKQMLLEFVEKTA